MVEPENSFEIKHKVIIVDVAKTKVALGILFSLLLADFSRANGFLSTDFITIVTKIVFI